MCCLFPWTQVSDRAIGAEALSLFAAAEDFSTNKVRVVAGEPWFRHRDMCLSSQVHRVVAVSRFVAVAICCLLWRCVTCRRGLVAWSLLWTQARILGAEGVTGGLVALETAFVSSLASTPEVRRKLRPLLDLISEAKRKLASK